MEEWFKDPKHPPGSPPTRKFGAWNEWLPTQLTLSLAIGVTAFFLFCFLRTRWSMVYMPRTKLKDFSPASAHGPDLTSSPEWNRFFGWIMPTLRTSEYVVLQTVGLDAAVLLSFLRMSFLLFGTFSLFATFVLIPLNWMRRGSSDSDDGGGDEDGDELIAFAFKYMTGTPTNGTTERGTPTFYDVFVDPTTSQLLNLIVTYLFTGVVLVFLHRNFHRFVISRQAFALQLTHSVPSRTVIVSNVPSHLRGDRALAEYFEGCGWEVESVSVCRDVKPIREALDKRTEALLRLELAWVNWIGNPSQAKRYDPKVYSGNSDDQEDGEDEGDGGSGGSNASATEDDPEGLRRKYSHIQTTRRRPTIRPNWFGAKVDAIEYWESKFLTADEEVNQLRKTGQFPATHVAFVTFEEIQGAQESAQVVHYGTHSQAVTRLAAEPRDVLWNNVSMSPRERVIRNVVVMGLMWVLLVSWTNWALVLSGFFDKKTIAKYAPWLGRLIDSNKLIESIVQTTLPSLAFILLNNVLPFFLEWMSYQQGFRARSEVEYSLTRKNFLFLLTSVVSIFIFSTYREFLDLADSPKEIPKKLADALSKTQARNFMISYVMLTALGTMPLQILNLGPLVAHAWMKLWAKTPRDFATANAPPLLNYGWVYPQALLIFVICLIYSVISPLILYLGAIYFAVAYLVYKYKLLFVYFKPYESKGEAWKITFDRLLWGLLIFQMFMAGILLRKSYYMLLAMLPLIGYTVWWSLTMSKDFGPLSKYVALSNICEVQRGETTDQVLGLHINGAESVQGNLNRKRYAMNDDTLYVSPSDRRTDYSQPPMNDFYWGVLNTGRRRYAHPALSGKLPTPWLPMKDRQPAFGDAAVERRGIVLSLRHKVAKRLRRGRIPSHSEADPLLDVPQDWATGGTDTLGETATYGSSGSTSASDTNGGGRNKSPASGAGGGAPSFASSSSNPWRDPTPTPPAGGSSGATPANRPRRSSIPKRETSIHMPDEHAWHDNCDDDDDDDTPDDSGGDAPRSPSTYFHRPNRRRTLSGASSTAVQRSS